MYTWSAPLGHWMTAVYVTDVYAELSTVLKKAIPVIAPMVLLLYKSGSALPQPLLYLLPPRPHFATPLPIFLR